MRPRPVAIALATVAVAEGPAMAAQTPSWPAAPFWPAAPRPLGGCRMLGAPERRGRRRAADTADGRPGGGRHPWPAP